MLISVQTADFNLNEELKKLRANHIEVGSIGAIVSFVGYVRDFNEGSQVTGLELEHYAGMTEQSLSEIAQIAASRWNIIDTVIIHRVGKLAALDQIVLVAVATKHRGDAFAACEFIMDYLKTQAPFWKKESSDAGEKWVDARESDTQACDKWQ